MMIVEKKSPHRSKAPRLGLARVLRKILTGVDLEPGLVDAHRADQVGTVGSELASLDNDDEYEEDEAEWLERWISNGIRAVECRPPLPAMQSW